MKHITLCVTNDISYDQRMQRIARSLSSGGYDVTFVGRKLPASLPIKKEPYKQVRLRCFVNKGKLFYLEYNIRLFFFLLFKKTDIICAVDLDTLLPCFMVSRLRRKTCVYDAHEYFVEALEVQNRMVVKRIWLLLERSIVPKIGFAYTVNSSIAGIMKKSYGTEFKIIRNVPVYRNDHINETLSDRALLYQGALNEGRGLEQAIMAMKNIDAVLWIAGEGDLSADLRKLVQEQHLNDKVIFMGYQSISDLKELTPKAAIGLNLLSGLSLSYYYSLANKFFDYMHAGVPSVCVSFPEYKLINDKYEVSLLIDNILPVTISNAVNQLLNDQAKYNTLKANCLEASKEYNWQIEEKKLLDIYAHIY